MKRITIQILLISTLLSSSTLVLSGSNNGYTTATNVYSGSSSLGWYGGGVEYWLAEWKKEKNIVAIPSESDEESLSETTPEETTIDE